MHYSARSPQITLFSLSDGSRPECKVSLKFDFCAFPPDQGSSVKSQQYLRLCASRPPDSRDGDAGYHP